MPVTVEARQTGNATALGMAASELTSAPAELDVFSTAGCYSSFTSLPRGESYPSGKAAFSGVIVAPDQTQDNYQILYAHSAVVTDTEHAGWNQSVGGAIIVGETYKTAGSCPMYRPSGLNDIGSGFDFMVRATGAAMSVVGWSRPRFWTSLELTDVVDFGLGATNIVRVAYGIHAAARAALSVDGDKARASIRSTLDEIVATKPHLGSQVADARAFSSRLPAGLLAPRVWSDDDSEVVFEWIFEGKHAIVSFEGGGEFGYAMQVGNGFAPGNSPNNLDSAEIGDLIDYLARK